MSAMHLFRTVMVALSNPKTFSKGLHMQRSAAGAAGPSPPQPKAWRQHFDVVFVDGSGWLNLAAHVSKAALVQVGLAGLAGWGRDAVWFLSMRLMDAVHALGEALQCCA